MYVLSFYMERKNRFSCFIFSLRQSIEFRRCCKGNKHASTNGRNSLRGWDGEEFQRYKLTSIRGYRDRFSKLEIKYLSDSVEISFSINLEKNADIRGLFINAERRLTDSEISTYNIRGSRSAGKLSEMRVPCLRFSGGKQICYYGGNVVCNENAMINQVISAIQYAGEFSSEE